MVGKITPVRLNKTLNKGQRSNQVFFLLSGSFDLLIPLLPSNYSYLAIDFPGHGFSSHLPKGCFYHINDYTSILEEIRTKFKWDKLSLMGHSMGDTVSFTYASLFPKQVDLVCAIDGFRPKPMKKFALFFTMESLKKAYATKNKSSQRQLNEYTYDQMKKIISGSSVDPNKAIYLLKRSAKPSKKNPNMFQFRRDIRLNYIQPFNVEHENSLYYIKNIRAPYLFIKTDDQVYAEEPQTFAKALDVFKKHNSYFEMLQVEASHHVHLNTPELIADKISDFFKKYHIEEKNNVKCLQPMSKM